MIKIYIAGPLYSSGTMGVNIKRAIEWAEKIRQAGYLPFLPHLYFFWDLISEQDRKYWMDLDLKWVEECDCVFRISGESKGADLEVEKAYSLGKPVFPDFRLLKTYYGEGK